MKFSEFDEFKDALKDFRELSSLAVKGALSAPIVAFIIKVGPPPTKVVSVLTCVTVFVVVVWAFKFWRHLSRTRLANRMKGALVVAIVSLAGTGFLMTCYTRVVPGSTERIVLGFTLRQEVAEMVAVPGYNIDNALLECGHDTRRVFTDVSLALAYVALDGTWLLTFAAFGAFVSAFSLDSRLRKGIQMRSHAIK